MGILESRGLGEISKAVWEPFCGFHRRFLKHFERECANTPQTRNPRLTAIRSFMKYVDYEVPAALDQGEGSSRNPVRG